MKTFSPGAAFPAAIHTKIFETPPRSFALHTMAELTANAFHGGHMVNGKAAAVLACIAPDKFRAAVGRVY